MPSVSIVVGTRTTHKGRTMKRAKITIIGAGNVGSSCAVWAAAQGLGDIVLIDIPDQRDKTAGKALDLAQCGPVDRFDCNIVGTSDYGPAEGSEVVIITAGMTRRQGLQARPAGRARG